MSKNRGYSPGKQSEDAFMLLLESFARFLLYAGGLALLTSVGFLVYYFILFSTSGVSPD